MLNYFFCFIDVLCIKQQKFSFWNIRRLVNMQGEAFSGLKLEKLWISEIMQLIFVLYIAHETCFKFIDFKWFNKICQEKFVKSKNTHLQ